jgi:hypothetical protein
MSGMGGGAVLPCETRGFGFTRDRRRTIIRELGPTTDIQAPEAGNVPVPSADGRTSVRW